MMHQYLLLYLVDNMYEDIKKCSQSLDELIKKHMNEDVSMGGDFDFEKTKLTMKELESIRTEFRNIAKKLATLDYHSLSKENEYSKLYRSMHKMIDDINTLNANISDTLGRPQLYH